MAFPWYDQWRQYAQNVQHKITTAREEGPAFVLLRALAVNVAEFEVGDEIPQYTDGLRRMLQDGSLKKGRNYIVNHNSQVITKYLLLDRLATLLGCSPVDSLVKNRVALTSPINGRLLQILKDASQWHHIGRAMHSSLTEGMTDLPVSPYVPPPTGLVAQDDPFYRNVNWLWGAQLSFLKSDIANAEGQMQLMAFMVNWHATHRTPFPSDVEGFFDPITNRVAAEGFQLMSESAVDHLTGEQATVMFESLKAVFDISVHISPLALLSPINFKRWSMDRGKMIEWAEALGPKPQYIREAENYLWEAIIWMVLGKDCSSALRGFLDKAGENMNQSAEDEDSLRTYFINGFVEGVSLDSKPSGATRKGSTPGETGDEPYPPVDSGSMGSVEQVVAPLEHLADAEEGFLPATDGATSAALTDGQPTDSTHGNDAASLGDVPVTLPEPKDDAGNNGPEASQLLRAKDVVQNVGDVQGVASDIPITEPPGHPRPPSPAAAATPAILDSAVTPALLTDVQDGEESALSSLTEDSDDERASAEEVSGGSSQVKSPPEVPGGMGVESGRLRKPAAIFTAGTVLIPRPPPKKRARVAGPELRRTEPAAKIKTEDDYWETTQAYWRKAHAEAKIFALQVPAAVAGTSATPSRVSAKQTSVSEQSVRLQLFDGWRGHPPVDYTFQPDAHSATLDIPLVQRISSMLASSFGVDGQPPHRLPSSSDEDFTGSSRFFVVDCKEFNGMDPKLIQDIFRHRHIVVTDVDAGKRVEFNARGLSMLAPLDQLVPIQYANKKKDDNAEAMIQYRPLKDLLDDPDSTVARNVLDLPLGQSSVAFPPMFSDISTDTYSAPYVKDLVKFVDLRNDMNWGTGGTKNALSWFHNDDEGLGTSVFVQAGAKMWVVADRKRENVFEDEMGDINVFEDWKVRDIDPDKWNVEAILLVPNSVLYMRPCTPHFVLGTSPTIVLGRHFYAASSIRRSCFGIVHTFIMGLYITNTFHDNDTKSLLRQMIALWYRHFIIHDQFGVIDPHVPDITTQDGLLDIIAVGCVLEFASALTRERYKADFDEESDAAIATSVQADHARSRFRVIMKTFATRYTTIISDRFVHPSYIWNKLLVQFGAALVTYMKKEDKVPKSVGVNAKTITLAVRKHLVTDHPHLVAAFNLELKKNVTALSWTGTHIEVMPRHTGFEGVMDALGMEEAREMPDGALYYGHADDDYFKGEWSDEGWESD